MSRSDELVSLIKTAATAYYNGDEIMSDAEYDLLVDELTKLDPNNKVLAEVGAELPASEWKKMEHPVPLGSLDKFNKPEEIIDWVKTKLNNGDVVVSEKLDGISIGCIYKDGVLVSAITRGNGKVGDDVLTNVVKMQGVVKVIPPDHMNRKFNGTVRGEIILTKTNHAKWFPEFANPRNGAAGISRRFDGEGSEYLTLMMYDVMPTDLPAFNTETEKFRWLTASGFKTPHWTPCATTDYIINIWQEYQDKTRATLDYEIDGLVVGIDDLSQPIAKEFSNLRPRAKKAFKFPNQHIKTPAKRVSDDIGATGHITPVCWFEPVLVQGSTIEKASVYNYAYIEKLGIGEGAVLLVCKANDIIPRVERVLEKAKTVHQPPTHCPACNTKLHWEGAYLICPNKQECKPQVIGRLAKWVSALDVLELGDALLTKLVEDGLVKTPADLYTLSIDTLSKIDRMGKKSAKNVHDALWKRNPITLDLFLGGLSIPGIGQQTIKVIMDAGFDTLEKVRAMSVADIEGVKGMGKIRAGSLFQGLKDYEAVIDALIKNGVQIKEKQVMDTTGKLSGQVVVFTGEASRPRKELQAMVESNGGKCGSSVSKQTTLLVLADPESTSTKANKARAMGVKLISEDQFVAMVQP
jgi:DNA ligase (NAD+)